MNIYRKSDIPSHLQQYFVPAEIGLEKTPDAFVAELVSVFREVKRVLRDDGTLWLNLGDSYNSPGPSNHGKSKEVHRGTGAESWVQGRTTKRVDTLKPKDLIGIPWRVAFALQADGWYLRSDIIWHKPNPMPESVTDRPTKAHEYLFLLAKSERYYYDADAIREDVKPTSGKNMRAPKLGDHRKDGNYDVVTAKTYVEIKGANRRSVWSIQSAPFKGAHFATFPPALIEPCILAGCPKDGVVLDPFGGAGTTGLVADRLGRNAILCELNPEYARMAEARIRNENPMFAEVSCA